MFHCAKRILVLQKHVYQTRFAHIEKDTGYLSQAIVETTLRSLASRIMTAHRLDNL